MSSMKDAVRAGYADVASEDFSGKADALARIAASFGYGAEDLAALPDGANMGLSCGNPVAMASLKPGETVIDLGSGGGLDVFLAARAVGPQGKAIGIDMTEEMVALARDNADKGGYGNVTFHHAAIESMPLASGSADCVISNCVLNLVDDKNAALAEIFRVLKPGGRLASDITLKKPLPPELAGDVTAWVSCIAGAVTIETYAQALAAAGFRNADVVPTGADLNVYREAGESTCCAPAPEPSPTQGCCGSAPEPEPESKETTAQSCCGSEPVETASGFHAALTASLQALDLNDYVAAVRIFAVKP
jgi:SAM-dependent methyltransferase